MNTTISTRTSIPSPAPANSSSRIAQGKMKTASMSKIRNSRAKMKYRIWVCDQPPPTGSIPHS